MARSTHHELSALADRCQPVGFVFAAASGDRHFYYFVAQTPTLVTRVFFCFRLFLDGITADTGINRQLHFSLFPGLRSFPVSGKRWAAGAGGCGAGVVLGFCFSEETLAAIGPLCWTAIDPRDGKLATGLGL